MRSGCVGGDTSYSLLYPSTLEAQLGEHDKREDNTTVRHGLWAGEEGMGGSIHRLHGGEGHACLQPAFSGQEAAGSVPPLPLYSRNRRLGYGEWSLLGSVRVLLCDRAGVLKEQSFEMHVKERRNLSYPSSYLPQPSITDIKETERG